MLDRLKKKFPPGTLLTIVIFLSMLILLVKTPPSQWGLHQRIVLILMIILAIKELFTRGNRMMTIALKDFIQPYSSPKIVFISIGLPLIMVFILGAAFGGFSKTGNLPSIYILNSDTGSYGKEFIQLLEKYQGLKYKTIKEYNAESIKDLAQKREICGVILIPKDYSIRIKKGETAYLYFNFDSSQPISSAVVTGILKGVLGDQNNRIMAFKVGVQTARYFDNKKNEFSKYTSYVDQAIDANLIPQILLKNKPYFKSRSRAVVFNQILPGMGVMFVLFSAILGGCVSVLRERHDYTLIRIHTLPVSKFQLIGGKIMGMFITILVQVATLFLVGKVLLHMQANDVLGVIILCLLYIFMAVSLGIMISSFVGKMEQLEPIAIPLILILSALGGCWFPLEIAPDFLKKLALFLPTGIAMHGFTRLLSFEKTISDILPHLIGLAGFGIVFFTIGLFRLNWLDE